MMNENKKLGATLLMSVGTIFVMIAGCIFATTAWHYLSQATKQLIIVAMTVGFFGVSEVADKKGNMPKTSSAFYYIGLLFTGLVVIALAAFQSFDFLFDFTQIKATACNLSLATLAMMVPQIVRLVRKQKGADLCILTILVDSLIFWLAIGLELSWMTVSILATTVMIILFAGLLTEERWNQEQNKNLESGFVLSYLFNIILYACPVLLVNTVVCFNEESILKMIVNFVLSVFLSSMLHYSYSQNEHTAVRVAESLSWLFVIINGLLCINQAAVLIVGTHFSAHAFWMLFFVGLAVLAVVLERMEHQILMVVMALIASAFQYVVGVANAISTLFKNDVDQYYDPYLAVMAIACGVIAYRKYVAGEKSEDDFMKELKIWATQLVVAIILAVFMLTGEGIGVSFFAIMAIECFMGRLVLKENSFGNVFFTILTLIFGTIAVLVQPYINIPSAYEVEYVAAIFGLDVFLLGVLFGEASESLRTMQFIFTCMLMAMVACADLNNGELINTLMLAIVAAVMLVSGAAAGSKRYMILASVVLILLVGYLTMDFWLSIAWWVYLMIAGIAMILLAMKKERELA